ncbi:hypothetical protein L2E82_38691 [Cichorium intybus]|uniref:Uncharacterized protein n=1 Tax=Cichorium intybus TaxID=13427 RepID=A0ACB9AI16_CICIN|nr:hypothetical protein L2E82_38691 [Cichorium intybus]
MCYQCGKMGHIRADCPNLKTGEEALKTLVTAPLRITDGRKGQAGTEHARGRAFQLTAEEVKATSKVVAGTFHVNSITGLVLFDSGATHSFVSVIFGEHLGREVERLDEPLVVEIVVDKTMKELCVVVGMDWMDAVDAKIGCRLRQIRVRTPSVGKLLIQGNVLGRSNAICSAARARRYLQQSGIGYLAYVVDMRAIERKTTIKDVRIVREFVDVFLDDLPGVPLKR